MDNNIFKKYDTPLKGGKLLPELIKIRGHQCEKCKLSEWQGQKINLQVHHINGDRCNNELDNLQLLCLNCHSQTENFGKRKNNPVSEEDFVKALKENKNIRQALFSLKLTDGSVNYERARKLMLKYDIHFEEKKINMKYCIRCGKPIQQESTYCDECNRFLSRVVERPDRETLKKLIRNKPFTHIAKDYGVSDKAIAKWCVFYSLPSRKSEIKKFSDEEWNKI